MTKAETDKEYCKLRDKMIENEFKKLSTEQREAVLAVKGPVLLIASPGSGKTTVIVNRAYNLIKYGPAYKSNDTPADITKEELELIHEYLQSISQGKLVELNNKLSAYIKKLGVNPRSILTLTFNKAAQLEMERRFQKLYGSEISEKVHFATLHSFCNGVVRDYERMKGQSLRRIEGSDEDINKKLLIKDIYYNINGSKINDDELDNLINEIGFIKNKLIRNPEDSFFSSKKFLKVYKAYEEYKKSKLMIDFDDMLTYAYSILLRYPQILNGYRNRYKYIQVDEGQDLSNIQFEILKLLAGPEGNIFIVADDDQSIYSFRGAEPQYILDIGKQFNNLRLFRLENNYRSSCNIVELSSRFITQNRMRYDKSYKTQNKRAYDPIILSPENESSQQDILLKEIKGLLSGKKVKSVAVLYRNNLSSVLTADRLQRNGIPFRIRQNRLFFFRHWLVREVEAFLMFALDGYDLESFTKICFRMNRFISKAMVECAVRGEESDSIIDRIINNHDLKPFQQNAMKELKGEFASLAGKKPWSALEYIKNNFNYLESIKEYSNLTGQSYEYLSRLYGILQGIAEDCPTISSFLVRLQELEQLFESRGTQKQQEGMAEVTLSTLHSSKGLEYDIVFMIDLMNSEIPGDKALENPGKSVLEEERRLFYVGMTRARSKLYLISPSSINNEEVLRSIFIKEVLQLLQKDIINSIGEGEIVNHAKFGKGVIVSVKGDEASDRHTIEIKFFKGGCKKLDLQLCLDNKLISFD
ncbi:MAG TPA: ATP-dependent helicase [Ruminiclostridium sp.]|nr:ATP-dependent helicase [Ruminiclostridium sp.]